MFGGGYMGNGGSVASRPVPRHNRKHSNAITLPPLAILALKKACRGRPRRCGYFSNPRFAGDLGSIYFPVVATSVPTTSRLTLLSQTAPVPSRRMPRAMPVASCGTSRTTV